MVQVSSGSRVGQQAIPVWPTDADPTNWEYIPEGEVYTPVPSPIEQIKPHWPKLAIAGLGLLLLYRYMKKK